MKTTNILCIGAVLMLFIITSCSKVENSTKNDNIDLSIREQLGKKLNSFETTEIDPSQIVQLKSSQKDAMIKLDFVDGKYTFDLKNMSPQNKVEVVDLSNEVSEELDLEFSTFDNYDQAKAGSYANFSFVNGLLYGSFQKDGKSYTLSPVQNILSNAPSNLYVIYPDEDYVATEISDNSYDGKTEAEEYTNELQELDQMGNTAYKTTAKTYTVNVNAFTSNEFRKHCKSKKQGVYAYITNNIIAVNQKLIQGNMPVRVVLKKVINLSLSRIPTIADIKKLKTNYFNVFLNSNPKYKEDANILFTANTTLTASTSPWTIGRINRMPTLAIEYIDGVARRDNWLAHELAQMLGCRHIPRNNSVIPPVMSPYIYSVAAEFKPVTKTNMTRYVNAYHYGL